MSFAGKAQQVAVFLQRYQQVNNDLERWAVLDQINSLYPDLECRHHVTHGIAIFVKPGALIPRSLHFHANVVIEVDANGLGTLKKCKLGGPGERMTAVDLAKLFQFSLTVPGTLRLTRWAAIEEDWI